MKKIIKCIICVCLTICMIVPTTSIAFAKDEVTPVVVVPGLGATPIYLNPGTADETDATGSIDANFILSLISQGAIPEIMNVINQENIDFDKIIDILKSVADKFENIKCDSNGNSKYNVGVNNYWEDSLANHTEYLTSKSSYEPSIAHQIADKIGAKNVYVLNYDWRQDICKSADQLNTLIKSVKKKTGAKKVTVVGGSLGTSIMSAYIDKYKTQNDTNRVVFLDGAFQGVAVTRAYQKDLVFNKDVVMNYIAQIKNLNVESNIDMGTIYTAVCLIENNVGVLCDYFNKVAKNENQIGRIYKEVLLPVMGNIPSYFECSTYNDYAKNLATIQKYGYAKSGTGLYNKISHYHGVQGRLVSNINWLKSHGVDVAIMAKYGIPAIPVTSAYKLHGDQLIDTKYESIGATTADFGTKLGYSGKYVSKDGCIDASTCKFKDNTWFIKDMKHMDYHYNSQATQFIAYLVTTDTKLNIQDVKKDTGNGQFLLSDSNQDISNVGETKSVNNNSNDSNTDDNTVKSPNTGNDYIMPYVMLGCSVVALICLATYKIKSRKIKE